MRTISLSLLLIFICTNTYAAKIYKHVPFQLKTSSDDVVIVNYDFSEKTGIHCTSSSKNARIDFSYKGHDKTASLPVILQSDHVPQKSVEQLADVDGQFKLGFGEPDPKNKFVAPLANKEFELSCIYLGEKFLE